MGIPPVSGTARTERPHDPQEPSPSLPPEPPAAAALASRLDRVLDVVGLLALGWMVALWHLGSPGVPALPGIGAFPGFAELSIRSRLTFALVVITLLLMIVVVLTFGRPPTRARLLAVVPLLIVLTSVGIWRFIKGFVASWPDSSSTMVMLDVGFWDGAAVSLGLAAVALLVIRTRRLTRRLLVIPTIAVIVSVTATLLDAVLAFTPVFGDSDRDATIVGLGLLFPPLLIALLGVGMAPGWLRELWRGDLRGAAALVLWGLVVGAESVLPPYFTFIQSEGRGIIDIEGAIVPVNGLDWLHGALAVAAAVLIAPVVRAYRTRNHHGRAAILSGPLAALALLLLVHLAGLLLQYRLLLGNRHAPGTVAAEQVIVLFGLIGAALMLLVAVRPKDRSGPLAMLGAALLIAVPAGLYVVPEALRDDPYHPLRSMIGTIIQPLSLWDGGEILLVFVLPGLLFALLAVSRRRGAEAGPAVAAVPVVPAPAPAPAAPAT